MIDKLNITGEVIISIDNKIIRHIPNLVVNTGKHWILERMINLSIPNQMSYFALGNGTSNVTNASITGNINLISGYNWGTNNQTFSINYRNTGDIIITLDINTVSLLQVISLINNRLQLNNITQIVCIASGNFIKFKTVEVGNGQYFTISNGSPNNALTTLGITSGTYTGTGVTLTDTTLENELSRSNINSIIAVNNIITYNNSFSEDTYTNISEAGIFNESVGGTMLARTVFNPINVSISQILTLSWKITIN